MEKANPVETILLGADSMILMDPFQLEIFPDPIFEISLPAGIPLFALLKAP